MSSVVYSLKNGINRVNNPSIGGVFAYGSYTSAGDFTLFTDYRYEDGTAFTGEPFNTTKPLVWKGTTRYPHLGFENLSPNSEITPQPFPSFGIYVHPFIVDNVRQDAGVRVTIPFSGNISIASIIQRADLNCGDNIGYRIMKNGVAIQARQFIEPSSSRTNINTPPSPFVTGDVIDFIVDVGSQGNSYCDDVALEISLVYQYEKIPTPIVTTTPISCSTTVINGTTAYVAEGTFVCICDGTNLLYSTAVVLNPVLLNGTFSLTGLDFTKSKEKKISIVLSKAGDINSEPVDFVIQDEGCVIETFSHPIVTSSDLCNLKCDYQKTMIGFATKKGDVVIFKSPYNIGDPVVAVGLNSTGAWQIKSSNFEENTKYIAHLISYYDIDPNDGEKPLFPQYSTTTTIGSISCEPDCVLLGELNGIVTGVSNGVLRVFKSPRLLFDHPIEIGVISDAKFNVKTNLILPDTDYILEAIKIN
jgi:hypothetical protein